MIPNLFSKVKIPSTIPGDMQSVVNKLKKSKDKEGCLEKAYDIISKKYTGCHIFQKFFDLFVTDLDKIWNGSKQAHCTNLNYLLRILLVKSNYFKDDDIRLRLTFVYIISLHQYLKIKLDEKKSINVDPWGASHGIKLGQYANTLTLKGF